MESTRALLLLAASCGSWSGERIRVASGGDEPDDELVCEMEGSPLGGVVGGAHDGCCGQEIKIGVVCPL